MSGPNQNRIQRFRRTVRQFYARQGRVFPWRKNHTPYRILVSEVMLQQTQTYRVIPKYQSFLKKFPTLHALAHAPLSAVLREWQGLGYNRRAKMLHGAAREVVERHNGVLPYTYAELVALPGIGEYTAKAVRTFAWDEKEVLIETNIRAVFLHEFFKEKTNVHDKELLVLIEKALPRKDFRDWYAALMDYGAYLKQTLPNPSKKSAHHTIQKPFKGSQREIRGTILRTLIEKDATKQQLFKLPFDKEHIETQLQQLMKEGLVDYSARKYQLPN